MVHLSLFIVMLRFRNQGSKRSLRLFNFTTAMSNFCDRTLIFMSSAYIEMDRLGSFSMDESGS